MEPFFSDDDQVQLAFLREEEVDELVAAGFLSGESRFGSPLEGSVRFTFPELILHITPPDHYPVLSEFNGFFQVENLQLGRVPCDTLREKLMGVYDAALETNTMSMWELREEVNTYGIFEHTMLVLNLVSETGEFLKELKEIEREKLRGQVRPKNELQTKRLAEGVKSSSETAREFLGNPEDVIEHIPDWMRVLHVEEILRTDLTKKFRARRALIRDELEGMSPSSLSRFLPPGDTARRTEDAIDKILRPRMTFHGTSRSNVPHIVRHGFLKPGTVLPKDTWAAGDGSGIHHVQKGSTYGRGIYSSPSAEFSLDYSGQECEPTLAKEYFGLKLIVCATLMGRMKQVDRSFGLWNKSTVLTNYDSHVANRDLEYIVFDPAQILPVYVVHLDWGEMNDLHHHVPSDPSKWTRRQPRQQPGKNSTDIVPTMAGLSSMAPGEQKRAKQAVLARARKWFPYGFGPKTGGAFAVEDVADVSDDEENYGEYQAMRMDGETGGEDIKYWSWVKAAECEAESSRGDASLDEYTHQRKNMYAPKSLEWDKVPLPGENVPADANDDGDLGIFGLLFARNKTSSENDYVQ